MLSVLKVAFSSGISSGLLAYYILNQIKWFVTGYSANKFSKIQGIFAMECFICLNEENLIQNSHCKCKFYYHQSCWDKYSNSNTNLQCPILEDNSSKIY